MRERYTDQARRVVALAQTEARALHHDHIGTEHILLGLVQEVEGATAGALAALGISLDEVRRQVGQTPRSGQRIPRPQNLPCTPQARTVLEQGTHWALRLGDNHIGTEHILLALTEEREGGAAEVLARLGADQKGIRRQVMLRVHAQHKQGSD
jgi:ATP-dependent Clp protease ATP-binding subunit ClpC